VSEASFALLLDAVSGLRSVTDFRMFGCRCLRADGKIFALVWKEGRIALKLPVSAAALVREPGARPWTIGRKKMGAWVLVPESFHDDADALASWARRAHDEVLASAPELPGLEKPRRRARK
jgi:TfoX/Sxy family transcriptional regulator of competence genes